MHDARYGRGTLTRPSDGYPLGGRGCPSRPYRSSRRREAARRQIPVLESKQRPSEGCPGGGEDCPRRAPRAPQFSSTRSAAAGGIPVVGRGSPSGPIGRPRPAYALVEIRSPPRDGLDVVCRVLPSKRDLLDVVALATAKVALGAVVLHLGFSHVSDDDYARTVIAERFAHTPHLDPSATSWLPLPFWITGAAMMALGRSLEVARAVAIVLGALSVAVPYAAMRVAGVPRAASLAATAVAMALPWNAWLGVATVPEAWTGALAGAAMVAMVEPRARAWACGALLAASLSRYETWPACAVLAALCATAAMRGHRARNLVLGLLAIAGPLLWMLWNAHAHGSPLHFLARVGAFRRAIGAAEQPLPSKLLAYPLALLTETPEAAALGAVGAVGLCASPTLRRRWLGAAACVLATMMFLVAGDVRDGAPTHHPERALSPLWWVLVGMGADTIAAAAHLKDARSRAGLGLLTARAGTGLLAACALAWCVSLPSRWSRAPGETEVERRDIPIARGRDMRKRSAASAEITPCSFEHFALIAAWGRPEDARLLPSLHRPPTAECPLVDER